MIPVPQLTLNLCHPIITCSTTKTSASLATLSYQTDDIIRLDMEDPRPVEKKEPAKTDAEAIRASAASYMSVNYWADYFDVTQNEIFDRVLTAVNPAKMALGDQVKVKPELYGPFWISSTIIFCLFAFGNLSSYLVGGTYNYEFISSASSMMYG